MSRWERFCIVGIGNHARTKLIPAILANGQSIAGLVSRQPPEHLPDGHCYPKLEDALDSLGRDVAIVIASPPSLHFEQACLAIEAGFDVFVEKPAFITQKQVEEISARCSSNGTVLVEAFMQRYTKLYRLFLEYFAAQPIVSLEAAFLIPAIPSSTFRSGTGLDASGLYDMGCYILALLDDLSLDMSDVAIVDACNICSTRESVSIRGTLDGIEVTAKFGVADEYENSVIAGRASGEMTRFSPFFYGRAGTKIIGDRAIEDDNAFEVLFSQPREFWQNNQALRFKSLATVTGKLEMLAQQLAVLRSEVR